jgi:acyl-CoA reductase-like NAD-dependent aldehyde dehydrogenase
VRGLEGLSSINMPNNMQTAISPYTQEPFCSRKIEREQEVSAIISKSRDAQSSWKAVSIDERIGICTRWLDILRAAFPEITTELAQQMGRYVTTIE